MEMDRMILGEGAVYSTNCNETGLNNNVIVCASSGGGKTMSIMEPRLLETFHSSLVVTVTKRKLVNKYKTVFSKRGYNVLDLNFVKPIESNIAYDPLEYVASYSDISFLSESIVKANPRKENSTADPYWDDAAISLLSALIAYVLMIEDKPTFADVLKLNDTLTIKESAGGSITTTLDRKFNMIAQKSPTCFAVTCWNSFKVLPFKTASCVYGALNTTIDTIFSPELRTMITEKNKVNFEELASQKTVLFISTSAVNPALSCFINMFYAQMFKQLFEFAESLSSGILPIPVSVLCDDFATGSRILNFPEYISIFREKQISVMLLLQSESQLERMYGHEDSVTIINNCDTYVYMGGMDLRTCRNISERLNVPLDEVLYMPLGQEVIFRRGQKPIITQRYNVLTDKTYLEITEQYEKHSRN
ncbi:MAG: type IV secretory system conjugative DNA transfer family protein [Oscillospiraceae bacterium]|nr:type IV secretory system conjugative DNA transfer family protein [Oscillospiraceae bacterium]